jgi:TatD DNase family protein
VPEREGRQARRYHLWVTWLDTHCHLNDSKAFPKVEDDLRELEEAGIGVIVIGVDPESSRRAAEMARDHAHVWAVVGRHPNYTADYDPVELGLYRELLSESKVVALGEIGLDWHWKHATPAQQYAALEAQFELARELDVPIVIHCREAYDDLMESFRGQSAGVEKLIFHCFAGEERHAREAIEWGSYFGIDGPITYPKSDELRRLVREVIPRDRILVETDSPYMAPIPYRGKPNHPRFVPLIGEEIARQWQVESDVVASTTTANARFAFRL